MTMRLTKPQISAIRQAASEVTSGKCSSVRVFGSRLDDTAKGGDLDLLLEFSEPVDQPPLIAAMVAAKVSRILQGRKVDVLLSAPKQSRTV